MDAVVRVESDGIGNSSPEIASVKLDGPASNIDYARTAWRRKVLRSCGGDNNGKAVRIVPIPGNSRFNPDGIAGNRGVGGRVQLEPAVKGTVASIGWEIE